MKPSTLNIIFSGPDVFSVLPAWPEKPDYSINDIQHSHNKNNYDAACEQSKANAIRIGNPEILNGVLKSCGAHSEFAYPNKYGLNHGQIFQVEGFEYETDWRWKYVGEDKSAPEKVAILKLAKEEEPKETPNKRVKDHTSEWLKKYGNTNKSEWNLAIDAVLEKFEPVFKIKPVTENLVDIATAFKLLYEEIEKLKK